MDSISKKLADALRDALDTIQTIRTCAEYEAHRLVGEHDADAAREALATYDAQQAQPVAAGAWSANAGSVWDHTGKWIADCNSEHAARIVQCVNAHDALVSALQNALPYVDKVRDLSGGDGDITAMMARDALEAAGVQA